MLDSLGIVLEAAYSLYLYNRVCFGNTSNFILFSRDLNRREFYAFFPLVFIVYLINRCLSFCYNRYSKKFYYIPRKLHLVGVEKIA